MQFATSEKAYWQPSCKASIQDTVIITGLLGHTHVLNEAVKTSCLYLLYFLSYFMLNMASENNSRNRAQIFANIQKSITPDCFHGPIQFLYHKKGYDMHFS